MRIFNPTPVSKPIEGSNPDIKIKLLFIGNCDDKSTLLYKFLDQNSATLKSGPIKYGLEFKKRTLNRDDKNIDVWIWNVTGSDQSITKAYLKESSGIFLVFNLEDESSFKAIIDWMSTKSQETISKWAEYNKGNVSEKLIFMLVGINSNNSKNIISEDMIREQAFKFNLIYKIVSLMDQDSAENAFFTMINPIIAECQKKLLQSSIHLAI